MFLGIRPEPGQQIAVVGAGISGLIAAHSALRAGYSVTVFEGSSRPGGLIQTIETPFGRAELAIHSIRATPPVMRLLSELNLPIYPLRSSEKTRWIFDRGRLRRMPLKWSRIPALLTRSLVQRSVEDFKDVTADEVGRFYFGDEFVEALLDPMTTGIFGVPSRLVSMDAAFPDYLPKAGESIWNLSRRLKTLRYQRYGKGLISTVTLKEGMGALPTALARALGVNLQLNHPIQDLNTLMNSFDHVILSTPAPEAGRLLKSVCPDASRALEQVQYVPLRTTTVFFSTSRPQDLPRGTGVLFSPRSKKDFLGILLHHSSFGIPVKDGCEFSCVFLSSNVDRTESDTISAARALASSAFGIDLKVLGAHDQVWRQALPLYSCSLPTQWREIQAALFNHYRAIGHSISIFGNFTGQISVRGLIETAHDWF